MTLGLLNQAKAIHRGRYGGEITCAEISLGRTTTIIPRAATSFTPVCEMASFSLSESFDPGSLTPGRRHVGLGSDLGLDRSRECGSMKQDNAAELGPPALLEFVVSSWIV